jgi:hypothetical protein
VISREENFNKKSARAGFTIIELLIFSAVFGLIIVSFITILVTVTGIQTRQSANAEAGSQGQLVVQQIQYYVENARLVNMIQDVATGTLTLAEPIGSSTDPTIIYASSGIMYIQQGMAAATAFTSARATVSGLTFTRHYNLNSSSSGSGTDSVSYSFTITAKNINQVNYSQVFQGSVAVLRPVPKIVSVQFASTTYPGGGSAIVTHFSQANATGSLLLALIVGGYTIGWTSCASISGVSDTQGNTWNLVSSQVYTTSTVNYCNVLYAATNVKSGFNTTTVTFLASNVAATAWLFEVRGVSTSSPIDATTTPVLAQSSMNPSSSAMTPTGGAETVLGISNNLGSGSDYPLPTGGFEMTATSSFNGGGTSFLLSVEDMSAFLDNSVRSQFTITGSNETTWTWGLILH